MLKNKKNLILIDGHALAFRNYFALERTGMKNLEDEPTWAVYGFFNSLFELLRNQNIATDAIAVAFDVGRQTFRLESYAEYKANRSKMPDLLHIQIGFIIEGLKAFNIPIYTKEGYEADDIIGTIAEKARNNGYTVNILTGDHDSFQLIDEEGLVKILVPEKNQLITYDWKQVYEKMGIYPNQVVDYKSLFGDTSDNIPGVTGIGTKGAIALLSRFQSLDNIYNHLEEIEQAKLREKLITGKEQAYLSNFLATIKKDVDINFDFESINLDKPEAKEVVKFFRHMNFSRFLKNIDNIFKYFGINNNETLKNDIQEDKIVQLPSTIQAPTQLQLCFSSTVENEEYDFSNKKYDLEKTTIDSEEKFEKFLQELKKHNLFSIDTETTSVNSIDADLVGISIAFSDDMSVENLRVKIDNTKSNKIFSYYIPLQHKIGKQLDKSYVLSKLKPILESDEFFKTTQNGKYDMNVLRMAEVELNSLIFDTMLASYIKAPERQHGLKTQALDYLGYLMKDIEVLIGKGKSSITIDNVPIDNVSDYACDDAFATLALTKYWTNILNDKEKELLYKMELPLIYVLSEMEINGMSLDVDYLKILDNELAAKMRILESQIYKLAGEQFNINSPKQVSEILFNKLSIVSKSKKRNTNQNSTSAKILEELAEDYEIAKLILEYRQYQKLKSTYIDALPELLSEKDRKIHTTFNQTVTLTGRLSSSNPNLQNIPVRTELGNRIRKAFIPEKNNLILSADYSQIELRMLAHCSQDKNLIDAFESNSDVHAQTAAKIFDISIEDVTKDMRRKAKAVNFGIVYGQTKYGLAKTLNITKTEAENFISKYFETYPNVKKYMDEIVCFAHENGYVETIYGRKRFLASELGSSNHMIKEFAQRAAINTPIQGSAADLMKLAMIEVYKKLKRRNLKSKLVLQVHDELILEVNKDELNEIKSLIQEGMTLSQPLTVPLKVDIAVGTSWMDIIDDE